MDCPVYSLRCHKVSYAPPLIGLSILDLVLQCLFVDEPEVLRIFGWFIMSYGPTRISSSSFLITFSTAGNLKTALAGSGRFRVLAPNCSA